MSATDQVQLDAFTGFVLGSAVGDALGLPREGLGPRRAARLFGEAPLRHQLVFGRGMVSDDTEHMRMTAQALLCEPDDPSRFARKLAWKLRLWLLALPAGTGMATAQSIIRLWLGWPPDRSGVYSAGNGPAMRAGILGVCLHAADDPLSEFVRASTRLTHTDPQAATGAMMVALAAREAILARGSSVNAASFLETCRKQSMAPEWWSAIEKLEQALASGNSAPEFAATLNCQRGVSGYIIHSVAMVLFCWLRWPGEFRRPLEEIVLLGGDTDSTGAVLGGLAGATCGPAGIPGEWIDRLIEWPYSISWMTTVLGPELQRRFGNAQPENMAQKGSPLNTVSPRQSPVRLAPLPRYVMPFSILGRNLCFLLIVLAHGFRRIFPPY